MAALTIKQIRVKTYKEIARQCERIFNLHIEMGYGTDVMFEKCERIFFKYVSNNVSY